MLVLEVGEVYYKFISNREKILRSMFWVRWY